MPKYYNWTSVSEDIVQDYFEAPSIPQLSEKPTPAGHVEGVPDDTRFCPRDVSPSSYCYDGGPYDYNESGLAYRFSNIAHDGHISERIYDRISQLANRILPSNHTLLGDYYSTTKLDDVDFEYYKFCGDARYKSSCGRDPHWKKSRYSILKYLPLTLCLQRLYSLKATAEHMKWHAAHQTEEGPMCHPSDAEVCKHFDRMYPDFAEEPRNVPLGLCTNSFGPHGRYGWLSLPYNLFPGICMSSKYMFLTMLWHVDVGTYDHATDRAFIMRTALMWTVNDIPAYEIAFGWITAGVMGCLVCMDDTRAFHPQHGHQILDRVTNISPVVEMPLSLPDGYGSDTSGRRKTSFGISRTGHASYPTQP
ncbi:UNVERIFIED_CONTAM: hypothetical protein Sangu_2449300 [Sesamum angustifolium]|uniref:Uncharacterized protein n=1 Tax=Sesamum angustifolium TaxID=2727405 RepID=A0AAW2L0S8_9LAMI